MKQQIYTCHLFVVLLALVFCTSCKESEQERIERLVSEWSGKEVVFPSHSVFTRLGKDTVEAFGETGKYSIVSYVDSVGCMSCKLQLPKWKEFMSEVDSVAKHHPAYRFYFHPKDLKELRYTLRQDRFDHPVCIDLEDEFNHLNRFPSDMTFQTFLLDSLNRVVAVGNPVHNGKVKSLYLSILSGKRRDATSQIITTASVDKQKMDLGTFDANEPQTATFTLTNTGENLLVIHDINTSCGCITAAYKKEPARQGKSIEVKVTYTAKNNGKFNKAIRLYCNTEDSPIQLQVKGCAK